MTATNKQFNDFITNEITKNLGITTDEYKELMFKAGIKAAENNSKYKSYFTKTGAFWDCYSHHVLFFNFKIITQDTFYKSLNNGERTINSVDDYFNWITQEFELPKRAINLIHKQYVIDFENSQIIEKGYSKPSKPSNPHRRTRAPQKAINQTAINLNTI